MQVKNCHLTRLLKEIILILMKEKIDNLLSVTETAKYLGVIRQRVLQLIDAGRLPAVKVGKTYVIKESDLELVKDRKTGRPPKKTIEKS